jgi:hypothetical protein
LTHFPSPTSNCTSEVALGMIKDFTVT